MNKFITLILVLLAITCAHGLRIKTKQTCPCEEPAAVGGTLADLLGKDEVTNDEFAKLANLLSLVDILTGRIRNDELNGITLEGLTPISGSLYEFGETGFVFDAGTSLLLVSAEGLPLYQLGDQELLRAINGAPRLLEIIKY